MNTATNSPTAVASYQTYLIERAKIATMQWPQYKNYFDNAILCQVTRKIVTKLGVAFERNDDSLLLPNGAAGSGFSTVWSFRNNVATSVPTTAVKRL